MTETCTGETNIKKGTTVNNVNKYNDMDHYYDDLNWDIFYRTYTTLAILSHVSDFFFNNLVMVSRYLDVSKLSLRLFFHCHSSISFVS